LTLVENLTCVCVVRWFYDFVFVCFVFFIVLCVCYVYVGFFVLLNFNRQSATLSFIFYDSIERDLSVLFLYYEWKVRSEKK